MDVILLERVPKRITTPTGRFLKHLIHIEPHPDWVALQLQRMQGATQQLAGNSSRTLVIAAPVTQEWNDDDVEIIEDDDVEIIDDQPGDEQLSRSELNKKIHAIGHEIYGTPDMWKKYRAIVVEHVTKKAKTSLAKCSDDEMREIADSLQKKRDNIAAKKDALVAHLGKLFSYWGDDASVIETFLDVVLPDFKELNLRELTKALSSTMTGSFDDLQAELKESREKYVAATSPASADDLAQDDLF